MSSLFRFNQPWVKILFAIVTIIVFVSYWNGPTGNRNSRMPSTSDEIGRMYGNKLTSTLLQREAHKAMLAYQLHIDLFPDLGQSNTLTNEAVNNFAINSLVLRHEADRLQLEPMGSAAHSDTKVLDEIKGLERFKTIDGQFDPREYSAFVSNVLPSLGFVEDDLEDLIAEDLRMKKLKALLATTFVVSPELFRAEYAREYEKMDFSVIHFKLADFSAKVQPTEDEIKKAFEEHADGYHSKEKRSIKFVAFALSDADKKLEGKDRIAALQKLSGAVQDFTDALQAPGAKFDDAAAKFKLTVTTVPPFAQDEPDPKVPQDPDFADAVFNLSTQNPVSEPLEDRATGSYYVVQLQEIIPGKLLTLAEARPQVIEEVKTNRAKETMGVQARDVRAKILADIAAGKSFADAAKAAGQTVEVYPPTSLADPNPAKEDNHLVMYTMLDAKEGTLSDFVSTAAGGIIVHLDKREPVDPKQFDTDRAKLEPAYDARQVDVVFVEWLRKQRDAAAISINGVSNNAPPAQGQPK